eukprot:CAMPEP_0184663446 /NCGR_PEP_ID=MMETSP0308-20130426/48119_1 /TAXON_ID=38269 /ORGANISM="Gloeochaete witrockiana, Strain SAG 46.84" /LENGTH=517 /DNA_ID=CAMNT_0027106181 /DNA_START=37 /DNA_END=1589 /DNA_ORIENTATION=+
MGTFTEAAKLREALRDLDNRLKYQQRVSETRGRLERPISAPTSDAFLRAIELEDQQLSNSFEVGIYDDEIDAQAEGLGEWDASLGAVDIEGSHSIQAANDSCLGLQEDGIDPDDLSFYGGPSPKKVPASSAEQVQSPEVKRSRTETSPGRYIAMDSSKTFDRDGKRRSALILSSDEEDEVTMIPRSRVSRQSDLQGLPGSVRTRASAGGWSFPEKGAIEKKVVSNPSIRRPVASAGFGRMKLASIPNAGVVSSPNVGRTASIGKVSSSGAGKFVSSPSLRRNASAPTMKLSNCRETQKSHGGETHPKPIVPKDVFRPLRSSVPDSEGVAEYQEQLAGQEVAIKILSRELGVKESELKQLRNQVETERHRGKQGKVPCQDIVQISAFKKREKSLENRIIGLESRLRESRKREVQLKTQVVQQDVKLKKASSEITKLHKTNVDLKTKLCKRESLEALLAEKEAEVELLTIKLTERTVAYNNLRMKYRDQCSALKIANERLRTHPLLQRGTNSPSSFDSL